jgi:hypothetical protein
VAQTKREHGKLTMELFDILHILPMIKLVQLLFAVQIERSHNV